MVVNTLRYVNTSLVMGGVCVRLEEAEPSNILSKTYTQPMLVRVILLPVEVILSLYIKYSKTITTTTIDIEHCNV